MTQKNNLNKETALIAQTFGLTKTFYDYDEEGNCKVTFEDYEPLVYETVKTKDGCYGCTE